MHLFQADSLTEIGRLGLRSAGVLDLEFSPDGRQIGVAQLEGVVTVAAVSGEPSMRTLRASADCMNAVAFHPGGRYVAAASNDAHVYVWDLDSEEKPAAWKAHSDSVMAVGYHPHGETLVTGGYDGELCLWNADSFDLRRRVAAHAGPINDVAFNRSGSRLATAGDDRAIRVWDGHTGELVHLLTGHEGAVVSVAFHPEHDLLLSTGGDGALKLWPLDEAAAAQLASLAETSPSDPPVTYRGILSADMLPHRPDALAIRDDRIALASSHVDAAVRSAADGSALREFKLGARGAPDFIAWSESGREIAIAGPFDRLQLYDAFNGEFLREFQSRLREVRSLEILAGDEGVVAAGAPHCALAWFPEADRATAFFDGACGDVECATASPDGERLALAGEDGPIAIWSLHRYEREHLLAGHADGALAVAFSPDGTRIVSSGMDGRVKVWNAVNGEHLATMLGHRGSVRNVAYSPDGRWLASGGADATVRLWDAHTFAQVALFEEHSEWVVRVVFSSDSRRLISASEDRSLIIREIDEWGDAVRGRLSE